MQPPAERDAIRSLEFEHRHIESVLAVLSTACSFDARIEPAVELIAGCVDFIEQYADGRHHAKEEHVLFEHMSAWGYSLEAGPLACMLSQHAECRRLTAQMKQWLCEPASEQAKRVASLRGAARRYIDLLSRHIVVEDSVLFPSALVRLPRNVLEQVARRYAEVDPHPAADFAAAADRVLQLAREVGPSRHDGTMTGGQGEARTSRPQVPGR